MRTNDYNLDILLDIQKTAGMWYELLLIGLVCDQLEHSCGDKLLKRISFVDSRELSKEMSYKFMDCNPQLTVSTIIGT